MKKIALSLGCLFALLMSSHAFACEYWEVTGGDGKCLSGYENYYAN